MLAFHAVVFLIFQHFRKLLLGFPSNFASFLKVFKVVKNRFLRKFRCNDEFWHKFFEVICDPRCIWEEFGDVCLCFLIYSFLIIIMVYTSQLDIKSGCMKQVTIHILNSCFKRFERIFSPPTQLFLFFLIWQKESSLSHVQIQPIRNDDAKTRTDKAQGEIFVVSISAQKMA